MMKLRNKKTGEIKDGRSEVVFQNNDKFPNPLERHTFESLAELNEEWEDYTPAEPLIKDEKIRKAVRAWAEANKITSCFYDCDNVKSKFYNAVYVISFDAFWFDGENFVNYTIAELCGDEEL